MGKFITPILNYGFEAGGFHSAPNIESVQLSFYKRILKVKKSTQNDFVYGILGQMPMQIHRHCRIIRYWTKIVLGKKSSYVNLLYSSSLQNIENGNINNWAFNVKNLLCSNGFGDIWRAQFVDDQDGFCKAFETRLFDVFRQGWSGRLSESSRASFYNKIIKDHSFNNMLDIVNVPSHRSSLTRLLCSSHRLRIETGRWVRPTIPRNNRICETCNKLDDEYHFLLECNLYKDNRSKFIKSYYWRRPSMFKCTQLMTTGNKKDLRNLAKYVYKCFTINSN